MTIPEQELRAVLADYDNGRSIGSQHLVDFEVIRALLDRIDAMREALQDADFAIETTVACLNEWNGHKGAPVDTDAIRARIYLALGGAS